MMVDHITKTIEVSANDLDNIHVCPICGEPWAPNGTGPESMPCLTKILQKLPGERVLGGVPPKAHDLCYLMCPEGWTVLVKYGGIWYKASNRRQADELYYDLMEDQIDAQCRYMFTRQWYKAQARKRLQAVRVGGHSSYKHRH